MTVRNLVVIAVAGALAWVCHSAAAKNRFAGVFAEALTIVEREALIQRDGRQLFESAMQGMLSSLDENSGYVSGQVLAQMEEDIYQHYAGVGLTIQSDAQTGALTVVAPVPGSPAQRAGLLMGDVIRAIDGQSTEGWTTEQAKMRMRGAVGSSVRLDIVRRGRAPPFELTLVREDIPVISVFGDVRDPSGQWSFQLESEPRIGFIRIEGFGEKTADEVGAALDQLGGKIDGLVIDLRNNGGGLLDAAVEIGDLFLGAGQLIVEIRDRGRVVRETFSATSPEALASDVPLAVLVNGHSASASEIVAACLQDHRRAVVVGERTYGKGTVQHLIPIEYNRSKLRLTVASYWRPSGVNIDRTIAGESGPWGVSPNAGYEVPLSMDEAQQLQIARLIKDSGHVPAFQGPDGTQDTIKIPSEPWEKLDRPLQRAIEYLKSQHAKTGAAAA
jgi:carboxyl-terminal processing protease